MVCLDGYAQGIRSEHLRETVRDRPPEPGDAHSGVGESRAGGVSDGDGFWNPARNVHFGEGLSGSVPTLPSAGQPAGSSKEARENVILFLRVGYYFSSALLYV